MPRTRDTFKRAFDGYCGLVSGTGPGTGKMRIAVDVRYDCCPIVCPTRCAPCPTEQVIVGLYFLYVGVLRGWWAHAWLHRGLIMTLSCQLCVETVPYHLCDRLSVRLRLYPKQGWGVHSGCRPLDRVQSGGQCRTHTLAPHYPHTLTHTTLRSHDLPPPHSLTRPPFPLHPRPHTRPPPPK